MLRRNAHAVVVKFNYNLTSSCIASLQVTVEAGALKLLQTHCPSRDTYLVEERDAIDALLC